MSEIQTKKRKFKVEKSVEGKRLDLYLTFYNNDWSRSFVKKQIEGNCVMINNTVEFKANYRVKKGDTIEITPKIFDHQVEVEPEDIGLDIVYEDDNLVIVNKPAGMTVHPATGNWQGTLLNALLGHYASLKDVGISFRSGLIHRLDKETSGLIMVAKTNEALWYYSKLFSEQKVEKKYYAIVTGDISSLFAGRNELVVRNFLGRNPKARKKFAVVERGGKLAETVFRSLRIFGEDRKYSLVEASPKTGRTHQIRVHLSSLGFPIAGDVVYGGERAPRLMLHSSSLTLPFLRDAKAGRKKTIDIGIPTEVMSFIYDKDSKVKIKDIIEDVSKKEAIPSGKKKGKKTRRD
ncbi:RluA family pseudouridine synthase [Candidatus Dojkabacteria bacterium]|nr:RluA family pseudouridine synthase [Candidatus Dojkabacteria bacterium]